MQSTSHPPAINNQKLSIRLLTQGVTPEQAIRKGVTLSKWTKVDGALIALDTLGASAPKWSRFLELSEEEKKLVFNRSAYGLVFVPTEGRWFAIAFGMAHVKLEPGAFEQDFGLRVVLNAVDPKQLKSADIRTPDENTLSRRSQTSRGSDQSAFSIDVERDLVRGLAGTPKDLAFGTYLAGTDGLTITCKADAKSLATICKEVFQTYKKTDYKADFAWIDQIRHEREQNKIDALDAQLTHAIDNAVKTGVIDSLYLAFPVIYDPEKMNKLRYKGFRSRQVYSDLELDGYLEALRNRGKNQFTQDDLESHTVFEVDENGLDCGGSWKIRDCAVFETELNGEKYVISGGRWYQIENNLASEVQAFFDKSTKIQLPDALEDENEETYNARIAKDHTETLLCLDRRLIKPPGASTTIEPCDFLNKEKHIIHIKDKTSSSRLSHLFNQGTVSARVLTVEPLSRDLVRKKILEVQTETGQTGFETVFPQSTENFSRDQFTVVYAVITSGKNPNLPFFSLVSFRQAAKEINALGYNYAFCWIRRPSGNQTVATPTK